MFALAAASARTRNGFFAAALGAAFIFLLAGLAPVVSAGTAVPANTVITPSSLSAMVSALAPLTVLVELRDSTGAALTVADGTVVEGSFTSSVWMDVSVRADDTVGTFTVSFVASYEGDFDLALSVGGVQVWTRSYRFAFEYDPVTGSAVPTVSKPLSSSASLLAGESFTFEFAATNTGSRRGYSPCIDLLIASAGSAVASDLSLDDLVVDQAAYSWECTPIPSASACIDHPYERTSTGAPLRVCASDAGAAAPGSTFALCVVWFPIGGYAVGAPALTMTVTGSALASFTLHSRFAFINGLTASALDWSVDASIVGAWALTFTAQVNLYRVRTEFALWPFMVTGTCAPNTFFVFVDIAETVALAAMRLSIAVPPAVSALTTPGATCMPNCTHASSMAAIAGWTATTIVFNTTATITATNPDSSATRVVTLPFVAYSHDAFAMPIFTSQRLALAANFTVVINAITLVARTGGAVGHTAGNATTTNTITLVPVVAAKTLAAAGAGILPGEPLRWTVSAAVSEYAALEASQLLDLLADGTNPLVASPYEPLLTAAGSSALTLMPADYTIDTSLVGNDQAAATNGTTRLSFALADLIAPAEMGPCASVSLQLHSTLAHVYTDTVRVRADGTLDWNVDHGDRVRNSAWVYGLLRLRLDNARLGGAAVWANTTSAHAVSAAKAEMVRLAPISLAVRARNGAACACTDATSYDIGDVLTFCHQYGHPSSDVADLSLGVFFPDPVVALAAPLTYSATAMAIPPLGVCAPTPSTHTSPLTMAAAPVSSTDSTSITFTYNSFASPLGQPAAATAIAICCTVRTVDSFVADERAILAVVAAKENGQVRTDAAAVIVRQPVLSGVASAALWPFPRGGSTCTTPGGPLPIITDTSTIANAPAPALAGSDLVRLAGSFANSGTGVAYNISLSLTLSKCYVVPADPCGLALTVTTGAGEPLTVLSQSTSFDAAGQLVISLVIARLNGTIAAASVPGNNVAIVAVDALTVPTLPLGTVCSITTTLGCMFGLVSSDPVDGCRTAAVSTSTALQTSKAPTFVLTRESTTLNGTTGSGLLTRCEGFTALVNISLPDGVAYDSSIVVSVPTGGLLTISSVVMLTPLALMPSSSSPSSVSFALNNVTTSSAAAPVSFYVLRVTGVLPASVSSGTARLNAAFIARSASTNTLLTWSSQLTYSVVRPAVTISSLGTTPTLLTAGASFTASGQVVHNAGSSRSPAYDIVLIITMSGSAVPNVSTLVVSAALAEPATMTAPTATNLNYIITVPLARGYNGVVLAPGASAITFSFTADVSTTAIAEAAVIFSAAVNTSAVPAVLSPCTSLSSTTVSLVRTLAGPSLAAARAASCIGTPLAATSVVTGETVTYSLTITVPHGTLVAPVLWLSFSPALHLVDSSVVATGASISGLVAPGSRSFTLGSDGVGSLVLTPLADGSAVNTADGVTNEADVITVNVVLGVRVAALANADAHMFVTLVYRNAQAIVRSQDAFVAGTVAAPLLAATALTVPTTGLLAEGGSLLVLSATISHATGSTITARQLAITAAINATWAETVTPLACTYNQTALAPANTLAAYELASAPITCSITVRLLASVPCGSVATVVPASLVMSYTPLPVDLSACTGAEFVPATVGSMRAAAVSIAAPSLAALELDALCVEPATETVTLAFAPAAVRARLALPRCRLTSGAALTLTVPSLTSRVPSLALTVDLTGAAFASGSSQTLVDALAGSSFAWIGTARRVEESGTAHSAILTVSIPAGFGPDIESSGAFVELDLPVRVGFAASSEPWSNTTAVTVATLAAARAVAMDFSATLTAAPALALTRTLATRVRAPLLELTVRAASELAFVLQLAHSRESADATAIRVTVQLATQLTFASIALAPGAAVTINSAMYEPTTGVLAIEFAGVFGSSAAALAVTVQMASSSAAPVSAACAAATNCAAMSALPLAVTYNSLCAAMPTAPRAALEQAFVGLVGGAVALYNPVSARAASPDSMLTYACTDFAILTAGGNMANQAAYCTAPNATALSLAVGATAPLPCGWSLAPADALTVGALRDASCVGAIGATCGWSASCLVLADGSGVLPNGGTCALADALTSSTSTECGTALATYGPAVAGAAVLIRRPSPHCSAPSTASASCRAAAFAPFSLVPATGVTELSPVALAPAAPLTAGSSLSLALPAGVLADPALRARGLELTVTIAPALLSRALPTAAATLTLTLSGVSISRNLLTLTTGTSTLTLTVPPVVTAALPGSLVATLVSADTMFVLHVLTAVTLAPRSSSALDAARGVTCSPADFFNLALNPQFANGLASWVAGSLATVPLALSSTGAELTFTAADKSVDQYAQQTIAVSAQLAARSFFIAARVTTAALSPSYAPWASLYVDATLVSGASVFGSFVPITEATTSSALVSGVVVFPSAVASLSVNLMARRASGSLTFDDVMVLPLAAVTPNGTDASALDAALACTTPTSTLGVTYGDPHIASLDGGFFDFHGVGEFVLTATADRAFEVHVRHVRAGLATINTAMAAKLPSGVRFAVTTTSGSLFPAVVLDGTTLTRESFGTTGAVSLGLRAGSPVFVTLSNADAGDSASPLTLRLEQSGAETWAVDVMVFASSFDVQYLTVVTRLPSSRLGSLVGLLGNGDGQAADDVPADPYGAFAAGARVTDASSLFTYAAGESTATYTDLAFPTADDLARLTPSSADPNALQVAQETCARVATRDELIDACVQDLLATNDPAFANSYVAVGSVLEVASDAGPSTAAPSPPIVAALTSSSTDKTRIIGIVILIVVLVVLAALIGVCAVVYIRRSSAAAKKGTDAASGLVAKGKGTAAAAAAAAAGGGTKSKPADEESGSDKDGPEVVADVKADVKAAAAAASTKVADAKTKVAAVPKTAAAAVPKSTAELAPKAKAAVNAAPKVVAAVAAAPKAAVAEVAPVVADVKAKAAAVPQAAAELAPAALEHVVPIVAGKAAAAAAPIKAQATRGAASLGATVPNTGRRPSRSDIEDAAFITASDSNGSEFSDSPAVVRAAPVAKAAVAAAVAVPAAAAPVVTAAVAAVHRPEYSYYTE